MGVKSNISTPKVRESEYLRLLGYPPGYDPGEETKKLMKWAEERYKEIGVPFFGRFDVSIQLEDNGFLIIDDTRVESTHLWNQFRNNKVRKGVLLAASAGSEAQEEVTHLWKEGHPDRYYFLDTYNAALVEEMVTKASFEICSENENEGLTVLPRYSPGYTGWDLSCQKDLYNVLEKKDRSINNYIGIFSSGMLSPNKSQFSLIGFSEIPGTTKVVNSPCESCSYPKCQYRRKSYKKTSNQKQSLKQNLL